MSARLVLGPFSGSAPSRLSFPLMLLKGLRHASQVAFVSSGAQELEIQVWIAVSSAGVPGSVPHSEYRLWMAVIA